MSPIPAFATPIAIVELPGANELNAQLAEQLLADEQRVPSWHRANIGGWHSPPDLSLRQEPCIRALMRAIVDQVAIVVEQVAPPNRPPLRYGVSAWATIMRDGNYVSPHDHGEAHWSTAYYVDAGDDADAPSGRLSFLDPRRSARGLPELELFPTTFEVPPRSGSLVIFPGWLQHFVHAYRGARPRICVSANVTMQAVG